MADRDQFERGFRRLSPEERAILVLHHFVGYTPSEIAELLGFPAGPFARASITPIAPCGLRSMLRRAQSPSEDTPS